ncbi:MAG: hypothetical protein JO267_03790 [Alphaproteobacteria bacterium]|nr:hypothetical protein [Alphaproteobacteria bacterium]
MSELEEAIAWLERAVARLEAAPGLAQLDPAASDSYGDGQQAAALRSLGAQLVPRLDAALAKIGQVLGDEALRQQVSGGED